jgi:signal transduction histidine kinase
MPFNENAITGLVHQATKAEDIPKCSGMETDGISSTEKILRRSGAVAHDLNNMLSAILGYAEMIRLSNENGRGEGYDPELDRKAGKIIEAANQASKLVERLISFSRDDKLVSLEAWPVFILRKAFQDNENTFPGKNRRPYAGDLVGVTGNRRATNFGTKPKS